jgi:heme-degrading monooxygenase HmoA
VIARIWRGVVRTDDAAEYIEYVRKTGIEHYRSTPGNLGAWILHRPADENRSEIITFSLWESMDSVRAFAGDNPSQAVYYPEDDRFLIERGPTVEHYNVD